MKKGWRFCVLLIGLLCLCAFGAEAEASFRAVLPARSGEADVSSVWLEDDSGGSHWLFLPSFADLNALCIRHEGEQLVWPWGEELQSGREIDVEGLFSQPEEGVWCAELMAGDETVRLSIMQSANLRTLFFFSDDPVNRGKAWVDASERHRDEATGSMALVAQDGTVEHAAKVTGWRGRGNSTWNYVKKPYQFKLEYKADLLKTGAADERSRTWVLLADAVDETLLRDRIAFDLGQELGMTETSRSEYVDLYYDGEYAGIYLLCEKVEVQPGRVEMMDYDRLIERWNRAVGVMDLDVLPTAEGSNAYGLPFTYVEGLVDAGNPAAGGYMLEMETIYTLSDKCHFTLGDGSVMGLKNPEYASRDMVAYVSEKLETLRRALVNHGVDPHTGSRAADLMDMEAFARIALINEFGYNIDGFTFSSSYFLLPEGEERFRPGPIWDYALAFRTITDPGSDGRTGFKPKGWLQLFYGVPEFRDAYQRICEEELYPCVKEILLGKEQGRYLQPVDVYVEHIAQAMRMNQRLWSVIGYGSSTPLRQMAEELKAYIAARFDWFYPQVMAWDQQTADVLELEASAVYLLLEDTFALRLQRWSNAKLKDWEIGLFSEATEENYAVWKLTAKLEAVEGFAFTEQTRVLFNGREGLCRRNEDGSLTATVLFEDPSYKPVYAYDEDIGMVYNHDFYAAEYPEVAEECEYDPVLMAEYFYDYGMEEDHRGNAFFKPSRVRRAIPELEEELSDIWSMYYWDFIDGRYEEWMPVLNIRYVPEALPAEEADALLSGG